MVINSSLVSWPQSRAWQIPNLGCNERRVKVGGRVGLCCSLLPTTMSTTSNGASSSSAGASRSQKAPQEGSARWRHFHSALQLAIQRAAHKWTCVASHPPTHSVTLSDRLLFCTLVLILTSGTRLEHCTAIPSCFVLVNLAERLTPSLHFTTLKLF